MSDEVSQRSAPPVEPNPDSAKAESDRPVPPPKPAPPPKPPAPEATPTDGGNAETVSREEKSESASDAPDSDVRGQKRSSTPGTDPSPGSSSRADASEGNGNPSEPEVAHALRAPSIPKYAKVPSLDVPDNEAPRRPSLPPDVEARISRLPPSTPGIAVHGIVPVQGSDEPPPPEEEEVTGEAPILEVSEVEDVQELEATPDVEVSVAEEAKSADAPVDVTVEANAALEDDEAEVDLSEVEAAARGQADEIIVDSDVAPKSEEPISEPPPSEPTITDISVTEIESMVHAGEPARPLPPPPPSRSRPPKKSKRPSAPSEALNNPIVGDASISEPPISKPQPPPRKKSPPKPPSARAVQSALAPPKFDAAQRKRAKVWWEELFTDDFARAILPLGEDAIKREVNFIEESLGVVKQGVVLDLACGTGEHAVELAKRGYNVVGFDLSVSQLAEASEHAQKHSLKINFLQGDMREMGFDNMFDGVYCWNTSFGYFEEEKNLAVIQNVFKALKAGGSFLLDVINRDFVCEQQPNQNWFEGDGCVCMDDMSVDFITSRLRVKRTVMLDDGRNRECAYSIRLYGLHELGKLLHDVGFRVLQASGHPSLPGVFLGASSPRVIILATKP